MADIKLVWDEQKQNCDIDLETINNGKETVDIDSGHDLITSVLISLLCNATAESDWTYTFDKYGWHGDSDFERPVGSRLWQLSYLPIQDNNTYIAMANGFVTEALAWLVDDNICKSVDVNSSIVGTTRKNLHINITMTKADNSVLQYSYIWNQ